SLGVVLYESLSGDRPFVGDHPTTVVYRIVHEPHPSVLQRKPTLMPAFDVILNKALAKDPAQRYSSCAEMGRDLERITQSRLAAQIGESRPQAEMDRTLDISGETISTDTPSGVRAPLPSPPHEELTQASSATLPPPRVPPPPTSLDQLTASSPPPPQSVGA